MSYVTSVKKLLSDDLKGLISHSTRFEEGSSEFKKCEESAWSIIVDRYYPSVNEHTVKSTLWEFVDKFKVHGFPQRAQNLTKLIETYTQLPYFKKYSNTEVQWGLIDFLIKLSFKPTNFLNDDLPLDVKKNIVGDEDSFDWTAHLKEGLEKFKLPSEDGDSLSEWSDDEPEEDHLVPQSEENPEKKKTDQSEAIRESSHDSQLEHIIDSLKRQNKSKSNLLEITDNCWWTNHALREIPLSKHPEANYCFVWEKIMNVTTPTRILSEYNVNRELIYMLAMPSKCYFIQEVSKYSFKVIPNITISTLSPKMFMLVIEENFCRYFFHIRKLQFFCNEMNYSDVPSYIPATYRAYSVRIKKHLKKYIKKLVELEKKVDAQDGIVTMRTILYEMERFLNQIEYLSKLHDEAVPDDWRDKDVRTNAYMLICVLYEELKEPKKWVYGDTEWQTKALLILFIDSLYPFLTTLAGHMSGNIHSLSVDEFFLSCSGEIIIQHDNLRAKEFWEPVLKTASSAIASCGFLLQLNRYTSFFKKGYDTTILFEKLVEKLSELLLYKPIDADSDSDAQFSLYTESASDKLDQSLSSAYISSSCIFIQVKLAVKSVIEEHMEPEGFAGEILLYEQKFLDHLEALFISLQITNVFSNVLIVELSGGKKLKKLIFDFEDCLTGVLPQEFVQNFRLYIDQNSFNGTDLLEFPDQIRLDYVVSPEIRTIISNEVVNVYSLIFSFLLKTRLALAWLNRLILEPIEETADNSLRVRRLCSLRIWFIHVMNSLNLYFSTYSNCEFLTKMKKLCLSERKISTIIEAHYDFVENWKNYCFLNESHPCYGVVIELINLCKRLKKFWKMEQNHQLANFHLDNIEIVYGETMKNFALTLALYEDCLVDSNDPFSFLYEEVVNNLPLS